MIDILLSTYNSEKYLAEQLESVMNQIETEWRMLWRDDGSTDRTAEIYRGFSASDSRFVVVEKGQNIGAMCGFETLLKQSKSDYIMFCDHDDVWLPEKIGNTMKVMTEAEQEYGKDTPILVYSDLKLADSQLNIIDNSFWHYAGIIPELIMDFATLAGVNCVTGCTMMINKAAKRVSLPFGKHAMMHDHVIALQVMAHGGHLVKNTRSDILYRQHGDNVVGATKVRHGAELILFRLTHATSIIKQNIDFMHQARDIQPLTWWEYVKKKTEYKRRRNG